jgi:Hemerythrin HHE cation binding domain
MSIRTTKQALDEHAALRDRVEHFLVDAHEVPDLDMAERIDLVERTTAFIAEVQLPHELIEERVLYPGAARLLDEPDASDTCASDRAALRELLGRLAFADPADAGALQEVLYALYATLSAHFWREEEVFVKLAGVRDQRRVRDVMARMETMRPRRRRFGPDPAQTRLAP